MILIAFATIMDQALKVPLCILVCHTQVSMYGAQIVAHMTSVEHICSHFK